MQNDTVVLFFNATITTFPKILPPRLTSHSASLLLSFRSDPRATTTNENETFCPLDRVKYSLSLMSLKYHTGRAPVGTGDQKVTKVRLL